MFPCAMHVPMLFMQLAICVIALCACYMCALAMAAGTGGSCFLFCLQLQGGTWVLIGAGKSLTLGSLTEG